MKKAKKYLEIPSLLVVIFKWQSFPVLSSVPACFLKSFFFFFFFFSKGDFGGEILQAY